MLVGQASSLSVGPRRSFQHDPGAVTDRHDAPCRESDGCDARAVPTTIGPSECVPRSRGSGPLMNVSEAPVHLSDRAEEC